MLLIQLVLYCAVFTLMVCFAVRGGAIDGLYFYPQPVQERAIKLGLTTREEMQRKRTVFMTAFYLVMATLLVLIIGGWNGVRTFWLAYGQALLFLEVMNVYDGIVIDKLWVGHSSFWVLPGTEDLPFVQTWEQVLRKRSKLALVWVGGAALVAAIVLLVY